MHASRDQRTGDRNSRKKQSRKRGRDGGGRLLVLGLTALALAVVAGLPEQPDGVDHSASAALSLRRAPRPAETTPSLVERPMGLDMPAVLPTSRSLALDGFSTAVGAVTLDSTVALAAADAKTQKKIKKLNKKITKLQAKVTKIEAWITARTQKITTYQADISSWQSVLTAAQAALATAEAMPQGTKAEIKARKKAIKKAKKALKKASKRIKKLQKKIAKFQTQISKKQTKITGMEGGVSDLQDKVDALTPDEGIPNPGEVGLSGLELPSQMSVVAGDAGGGGVQAPSSMPGAPGDLPAGSDYYTDESFEYVFDPSMEPLDTVNEILSMISQTAHDLLVNRGPYNALIETSDRSKGEDTSDDKSSQSTGKTKELELWVVNSVRADATSDQFVACWVPMGDEEADVDPTMPPEFMEPPGSIHVLTRIREGVSESNPFGVFSMDFAGVPDADPTQSMFWGTLATVDAAQGTMGFTFYETMGDPSGNFFERRRVNVNMTLDGSAGVGRVVEEVQGPWGPMGQIESESNEFLVAFNDSHLLRSIGGEPSVCLSRDTYDSRVWRYNLYHADGPDAGKRVELNSGFGFKTEDGQFGWAGYWGMWIPDESALADGDTVYRDNYDGGDPDPYTVVLAPGKLIRNMRQQLLLQDMDGAKFEWWNQPAPKSGEGGEVWVEPEQFMVEYRHSDGQFWKVASFDMMTGAWADLEVPEPVDTFAVQWLGMWSQSLGGPVNYLHGDPFVTIFKEEVITGGSDAFAGTGELELFGFVEALRSNITGDEASQGDVFLPESLDLAQPYRYVFHQDDLTLYLDVNGDGSVLQPAGLASGATFTGGPFEWGLRSGPMVEDTSAMAGVWDAWDQSVFYTYETGQHSWNRFSTLVDAQGAAVTFDPPVQFAYTHTLEADRNGESTYAGETYMLDYNGPGDLWGIPFAGFDMDEDGFEDRWYPQFSIADGTLMGPTGIEYVIRALDMERTLSSQPGGCSALNIDTVGNLTLPSESSYEFPDIGTKPVVNDPPKVIAGELQGSGGGGSQ